MGRAAVQYSDLNVGVENVSPINRAVAYTDFNIGLEEFDERDGVAYSSFNVGLEVRPHVAVEYSDVNIYPAPGRYKRGAYVDFNVDPTATPVPHIWFVRPQQGKEGLIFNIIGQGFGTTKPEFDGKVMLGDLECTVTQWTTVPPGEGTAFRIAGYWPTPTSTLVTPTGAYWATARALYNPGHAGGESPDPSNVVTFAAGDTIEFEQTWIDTTALYGEQAIIPWFQKVNNAMTSVISWNSGVRMTDLVDQYGTTFNEALYFPGMTRFRKFDVPAGLVGVKAANWGGALVGTGTTGRPDRVTEFQKFVIRDAAGVAKFWVTCDDGAPESHRWGSASGVSGWPIGWSNIGVVGDDNDPWNFVGLVTPSNSEAYIDWDSTSVAHEHIIAIVPDGAESGMVKVVLEDV